MANRFREASSAVGNSAESDPDEVDNTDAPVSVQSCLACFTKPELLSKTEHAWQCENCAKLLLEQKMRFKKKLLKPGSWHLGNVSYDSNPRDIDLRATNGSARKGLPDAFDDRLVYRNETNGYSNCMPETSHGADQDLVPHPSKGGVHLSQDEAGSLVNCDNQNNGVQLDERSANCESGESENETDSKGVKVERDATKRILIDKVPPILTIHLKRFSQDARGHLSKLGGHVNFRDTIDLTTFVDPSSQSVMIHNLGSATVAKDEIIGGSVPAEGGLQIPTCGCRGTFSDYEGRSLCCICRGEAQRSLGKTRTQKIMFGMPAMPTYLRSHWKKFFGVKPIFCSMKTFDI